MSSWFSGISERGESTRSSISAAVVEGHRDRLPHLGLGREREPERCQEQDSRHAGRSPGEAERYPERVEWRGSCDLRFSHRLMADDTSSRPASVASFKQPLNRNVRLREKTVRIPEREAALVTSKPLTIVAKRR